MEPVGSLDALIDQLKWKREELVAHFYGRHFGRAPEMEAVFDGVDRFDLNRKFGGALLAIVRAGRDSEGTEPRLLELARDHWPRDIVTRERLELFRDSMIRSLRYYAAEAWNDELQRQWDQAFATVADLFLSAPPPIGATDVAEATLDSHREPPRT